MSNYDKTKDRMPDSDPAREIASSIHSNCKAYQITWSTILWLFYEINCNKLVTWYKVKYPYRNGTFSEANELVTRCKVQLRWDWW